MEDDRDMEPSRYGENWLGNWEDETISQFEQEADPVERLQMDRDETARRLWLSFQHSAACVAQLYKDRHQGLSVWIPFQNAAGSITQLYKDASDSMRQAYDLGVQSGHQKRTRELVSWAKKRRHHIRREDLIAHLCNRNPPVRQKTSHTMSRTPTRVNSDRSSPLRMTSHSTTDLGLAACDEPDLQPFRDALDLHGLDGAMSDVSVGFNRPTHAHNTSPRHASNAGFDNDLNLFIMNEFTRHNERKRERASSPSDVMMDSPGRKRSRLF